MILAADASTTHLGLAIGGPDNPRPRAWTVLLPGAGEHVIDRSLGNAADTISLWCRTEKVQLVALEAPLVIPNHSTDTMLALIQMAGAVRAAAHRSRCRCMLVAPSTVRKYFVGQGFPDDPKGTVMKRCKLLGWHVEDDNAADAAALWAYAMSLTYPKWAPNATPLFARTAA